MPGIVAENKFNIVPDRVPTAAARMEMPGRVSQKSQKYPKHKNWTLPSQIAIM